MTSDMLEVKGLVKLFPIRSGLLMKTRDVVHAVDGIDFHIKKGKTLGLVGESGCGKTTVGRCILRLIEPTAGEIYFEGTDVTKLGKKELRKLRCDMQMVFQDPYSSLNPRISVKSILNEPLVIHKLVSKDDLEERVLKLLETVGLNVDHLNRYPHEFSGGQKQRIGIARALALNPKFLVLDEPTSALDVSVQAQILNLLRELQKRFELTYLFISHDLSVIKHMSTHIAVMYVGRIMEAGIAEDIFRNPEHPYTQALFSAILEPGLDAKRERIILQGDIPSPVDPPKGCRFHTRCQFVRPTCKEREPETVYIGKDHLINCHLMVD